MFEVILIAGFLAVAAFVYASHHSLSTKLAASDASVLAYLAAHGLSIAAIKSDVSALVEKAKNSLTDAEKTKAIAEIEDYRAKATAEIENAIKNASGYLEGVLHPATPTTVAEATAGSQVTASPAVAPVALGAA